MRAVFARVRPDDPLGSLRAIIAEGAVGAPGPEDWRALLVREPRHLEYCRRRNLRWPDDSERVLLVQRERLSGVHIDLHLHELWLQLEEQRALAPWGVPEGVDLSGDAGPRLVAKSSPDAVTLILQKPGNAFSVGLVVEAGAEAIGAALDATWSREVAGSFRRPATTVDEALASVLSAACATRLALAAGVP